MTTYNTGNPVGSTDVYDRYDNTENLDYLSVGNLPAYPDRLGVARKSWKGMELDFAAFLASSGFELPAIEYTGLAPLVIDRPTQLIFRTGSPDTLYGVKSTESFPVTLTGTWATDEVRIVVRSDGDLRQDLANSTDPAKGAVLVGYMGRTQAARNMDAPSVYDYDGATFQQRLEAGINAGGPLIVPPGVYSITPMALAPASKPILYCDGVTFTAGGAGALFNFSDYSFEFNGGTFDLSAHSGAGTNAAIFSDGADSAEVHGVTFLDGAFGARIDNAEYARIEGCLGLRSLLWHIWVSGAQSGNILYNRVGLGLYDGVKVGGVDVPLPAVTDRFISIVGNVTWDNTRDGVDIAANTSQAIIIRDNRSYNDKLRAVDFKAVYQGLGAADFIIDSNLSVKLGLAGELTAFSAQCNPENGKVQRGAITNNRAFTDSTTMDLGSSGVRIANCADVEVKSNKVFGYYYGARVYGNSVDVSIKLNTFKKCVNGVQSLSDATGTPLRTVVAVNNFDVTGHQSGTVGAPVILTQATDTEVFDNEWVVGNAAYSIQAENIGNAATGTKIGTNYRGWSSALPTGQRCVNGESWRVPTAANGFPEKWVCHTQTSSSSSAQVAGFGQRGYRSNAGTPVSVLTPQFIGERVLDTTTPKWWTSYGNSSASWV